MHAISRLRCVAPRAGKSAIAVHGRSIWGEASRFSVKDSASGLAVRSRNSTPALRRTFSDSSSGFSHIDPTSNNPTMVNVSDKKVTHRTARACAMMRLPPEIMNSIDAGEVRSKKGPVFATAIIAGTMAAKRTHDLIPFCHPLGLESCKIYITVDSPSLIKILCDVTVTGKTGVEMEALTGARRVSRHGNPEHKAAVQDRRQERCQRCLFVSCVWLFTVAARSHSDFERWEESFGFS